MQPLNLFMCRIFSLIAEEALLSWRMAPMMSTTSFAGRIWRLSCVQAGPCFEDACVLLFLLHFCSVLFSTVVTHSKRSARLSMLFRDYTEFFAATAAFMCGDEMPTLVENCEIFVRNTKQVLPVLHCKQRHPGSWLYPSGRQT